MRVVKGFWLVVAFVVRVVVLTSRYLWRKATRPIRERKAVQLRDALTGQKLGMTKRQYQRYVYSLGTKDPRQIIKAYNEVHQRKRQLVEG